MKVVKDTSTGTILAVDLNDYHYCRWCNVYSTSRNYDMHRKSLKHQENKMLDKKYTKLIKKGKRIIEVDDIFPTPKVPNDKVIYILKSNIK